MSEKKLQELVKIALKKEDFFEYTITTNGQSGKDEGYVGNIFFITVSGKTKNGDNKLMSLVIKASTENETLRQQVPIKEAFEKEIFMYSKVIKLFRTFQQEVDVENLLDFLPHCYVTEISDTGELLVFENLKSLGYSLWNRKVPMTYNHIKLVLQALGKWHAFSFALREKRIDIFEEICRENVNMFSYFNLKADMLSIFLQDYIKSRDVCLSSDDKSILQKLSFCEEDVTYNFTDLFSEEAQYHVISHGDCWNNNFMFKIDKFSAKPTSVKILDWQCSGLSSPVMDLSHFLYCCCDTGKYPNVAEFLEIYYDGFSKCLEVLDCDAEKLFPYKKLLEHWKKFSRYGILLQAFVLKLSMWDTKEAPDLAEAANAGKHFRDNFNVDVTNKKEYYNRVKNNLLHYANNLTGSVK